MSFATTGGGAGLSVSAMAHGGPSAFDFDNSSHGAGSSATGGGGGATSSSTPTKKTSSKKSRALFKNRFMNKTNNGNGNGSQRSPASPVPSDNYDSPLNKSMGDQSGTTATTASMSVGSGGSRTPNRSSSLYGGMMNGGGGGGRNNNNMSTKNSSVAPPPPSSSNNNGQNSPKFEFTLFDEAASPKSSTGMKKSLLLSNKPNPYSNLTSSFTSTSSSAGNQQQQQQQHQRHLSGDLANPYGLSSDRTAASGYISEVSEFSFDRVTVTTERTGMSSNVSWNFLDGQNGAGGGLLDALGSGGGGGGGTGGATKLQPPDIDKLLLDEDDLLDGPNHNHQGNRTSNHRMNVFTGEIHEKCDQSVISEISEGIDGHDDDILHQGGVVGGGVGGGGGDGMDFINSILTEKYDTMDVAVQQQQPKNDTKVSSSAPPQPPQQRQSSPTQQQLRKTVVTVGTASGTAVSTTTTTTGRGNNNNNNTVSTVSSTNNSAGGITSVESAYNKFKRNKNKGKAENRSILHAIIEDIQFCGMYFCGLDTTVEPDPDDGQLTDHQLQRDVPPHSTPSKEDRAKEMDNAFLGKFIQCTPCGADTTIPDDATPSTR